MGFGRNHRFAAVAWTIASGSCILYTGKLNRPPVGVSITATTPLWRGKPITLQGIASDPDGDALTFDWAESPGACPTTPELADLPPVKVSATIPPGTPYYTVQVDDMSPLCVWLRATDTSGAQGPLAAFTVAPQNQPPTAFIDRQQPAGNAAAAFPLYSDFRFTAARSSDPDGDPITRAWRFIAFPDTSLATLVPCAPSAPTDAAVCFHADVPGSYVLGLAVGDGTATTDATPQTMVVAPDAPPCLVTGESDRRVIDPAEPQSFSVSALDDGDPWPVASPSYAAAGYPRFTWSLRRPGSAWQPVADYTLPSLTLAANELSVGDQVEVRVEVADRVTRSLAACGDDATCAMVPGCPQRLTFLVEAR